MKMPLGMQLGLGPGHIVLDGNPAPPKEHSRAALNFRPMSIVPNGRPSQPLLSTFVPLL